MDMNVCAIDKCVAFLARKDLVYILREDPAGLIAKKFPTHPGHAYVVEWFKTESERIISLWLTDTGQLHERIMWRTALFDTFEEATTAAEEFDRRVGVGTTVPMMWKVGILPPPQGRPT